MQISQGFEQHMFQSHHGALLSSVPIRRRFCAVSAWHIPALCPGRLQDFMDGADLRERCAPPHLSQYLPRDDFKGSKAAAQRLPEKKHAGTKLFGERSHCLQLNHTKQVRLKIKQPHEKHHHLT